MRDFKLRRVFMIYKLTVATVLKPQGIRGELKLKVLCDGAEELKDLKRVFIDGDEYAVYSVRGQGETAFVTLKGVFDRNAAELLRGKEIEALRGDLPPLPEDRFYIADLTGCKVVTSSGETVGEVVSVTPARTDIYYLKIPDGEISFAAAKGVIESVDILNKIITVDKKRFEEVSV